MINSMKNSVKTMSEFIVKENSKRHEEEKLSFLSHISHGIRTPLNSIMGFSKLLVSRNMVDSKQKEYVKGILSGSNLLLEFVDNVMDLSQFETNNYTLRLENSDINKILWEFTENFYNQKIENNDTNINLMLVWESKVSYLYIETDSVLLKKALRRLINLVVVKYPITEFELGYRTLGSDLVQIFIRPSADKLHKSEITEDHDFYQIDENNSFDYFNYKVLSHSVKMLQGELCIDSERQEFSFKIPMNYKINERLI